MEKYFFEKINIKNYVIYLRIKKNVTFHFYHGAKLYGFVSSILKQHPIAQKNNKISDVIIYPSETGRINYSAGDYYTFGITFINEDLKVIGGFIHALNNLNQNSFIGDFNSESVEFVDIKEIDLSSKFKLNKKENYTLNFITPLRIERKIEDKEEGKNFFDTSYFDVTQFFKLLYKRTSDIYKNIYNEFPSNEIPKSPLADVIDTSLMWIDMPKENGTLGGICGTVSFKAQLDEFWQKLLLFGQFINVGRNSAFGFGKYFVNNDTYYNRLPKAAATIIDRALAKENLCEAFEYVKANLAVEEQNLSSLEVLETNCNEILKDVSTKITDNIYKPDLLKGIPNKKNGKEIALVIPSVRDKILQRAVAQIINESIYHLLEENSFAYRKGFSRIGAKRAVKKLYNEGYKNILESEIESLYDNVNWALLENKLKVVFGFDPVVELLMLWVKSNVLFNGKIKKRTKGLPAKLEITPVLAELYLDEFEKSLNDNLRLVRYGDSFVILCRSNEQKEEIEV